MPKQASYTKDDIVNASIEIISEQGAEALTARAIGKVLGCSVAPLFRTFENMNDLMTSVRKKADDIILEYIAESVNYNPAFKEMGMRMIRFAKEKPNLFRFLFLDKIERSTAADGIAQECLKQTVVEFGLTEEQAKFLYEQTWPLTCGIAFLACTTPEMYSDERISNLLTTQFIALIMLIKSGRQFGIPMPQMANPAGQGMPNPMGPGMGNPMGQGMGNPMGPGMGNPMGQGMPNPMEPGQQDGPQPKETPLNNK